MHSIGPTDLVKIRLNPKSLNPISGRFSCNPRFEGTNVSSPPASTISSGSTLSITASRFGPCCGGAKNHRKQQLPQPGLLQISAPGPGTGVPSSLGGVGTGCEEKWGLSFRTMKSFLSERISLYKLLQPLGETSHVQWQIHAHVVKTLSNMLVHKLICIWWGGVGVECSWRFYVYIYRCVSEKMKTHSVKHACIVVLI